MAWGLRSKVIGVLALGFVPIVAILPLETALFAIGTAGRLLIVRGFAAAITFTLLVLLAPPLGVLGAAWAVTTGAVFTAIGLIAMLVVERNAEARKALTP